VGHVPGPGAPPQLAAINLGNDTEQLTPRATDTAMEVIDVLDQFLIAAVLLAGHLTC